MVALKRWTGLSLAGLLLLWLCALPAQAELNFPALTGRVVDNAAMLSAAQREQLTQALAAHEQATGEQVVVVTVPDLQGTTIEEFGYQLGRHWAIGQKGKNNGALLIVARDERRLRIEVGYGLEDRLTDAQASVIINEVITPAFKAGDYGKGITEGVAAILQVLGGDPLAEPQPVAQGETHFIEEHPGIFITLVVLFILFALVCQMLGICNGGSRSGGYGGGGFGGGSGGGGFSGGGGSFGGGGSSGGW